MSVPLVSVIMTVYNCEKYIEESLDSIFNQTFKDFEVVVYTDACTDKTQEIVGRYFNNYKNFNHLIYGRRDGPIGCFKGRMEAIVRSKGKYIAIQDGDDISLLDRLEKEVNFLEENEDIFCVGGWANKIDENGEDIGTMEYPPDTHDNVVKSISKFLNPMIDPTTMFRKVKFLQLRGYSLKKDRDLVDDFDFWCRAILNGYKIYNLQTPLIKYRINSDGNTRKHKMKMIKQHTIVWKEFRQNMINKGF